MRQDLHAHREEIYRKRILQGNADAKWRSALSHDVRRAAALPALRGRVTASRVPRKASATPALLRHLKPDSNSMAQRFPNSPFHGDRRDSGAPRASRAARPSPQGRGGRGPQRGAGSRGRRRAAPEVRAPAATSLPTGPPRPGLAARALQRAVPRRPSPPAPPFRGLRGAAVPTWARREGPGDPRNGRMGGEGGDGWGERGEIMGTKGRRPRPPPRAAPTCKWPVWSSHHPAPGRGAARPRVRRWYPWLPRRCSAPGPPPPRRPPLFPEPPPQPLLFIPHTATAPELPGAHPSGRAAAGRGEGKDRPPPARRRLRLEEQAGERPLAPERSRRAVRSSPAHRGGGEEVVWWRAEPSANRINALLGISFISRRLGDFCFSFSFLVYLLLCCSCWQRKWQLHCTMHRFLSQQTLSLLVLPLCISAVCYNKI